MPRRPASFSSESGSSTGRTSIPARDETLQRDRANRTAKTPRPPGKTNRIGITEPQRRTGRAVYFNGNQTLQPLGAVISDVSDFPAVSASSRSIFVLEFLG